MVLLMERGNLMLITIIYLCFSTVCFSSISKKKNDLSLHQYSEGGEVVQVSYASQAVDRSSTGLIGFSERDFSVVFAIRPKPSSLQVLPASKFVIEKFTQSVGVAMCGYSADNEYSRSKCNLVKQLHILRFGETPLIDNVAKSMSRWLTRGMYIGEEDAVLRPVATAVLLFGRDSSDSSHRLVLVENSGSVKECSFVSTGNIPGSAVTLMNIQRIVQHGMDKDVSDDIDHAGGLKERIKSLILKVAAALCDSEGDGYLGSRESVHTSTNREIDENNDQKEREEYAEGEGKVEIECSVCSSDGMTISGTFSSLEKLSRLLKEGWLR